MSLVLTPLSDIPLIFPGNDLAAIIIQALDKNNIRFDGGDVLVLAQKIVSKAENRLVNLNEITPSSKAEELAQVTRKDARFVELVLRESNSVLRAQVGTLIVEHHLGFVCANAGIDHSNVEGAWGKPEDWVLLLPENPDRSAANIRQKLETYSGVKLGVSIIDSHGRAWRNGVVGTSIGISGLPGMVDMRGKPDLFGYQLRITTIAAADELAAAASLMMGQADEKTPVVHVRGFPYPLRESGLAELIRPKEQDLFR
jgi:coenzyme F420-0:L-glutamate ligase / coenzyme F420-1:gamma-L-glutamate ligase